MAKGALLTVGVLAALGGSSAAAERVALELSPMILDRYVGGEYVANDQVSSTSLAIAYERMFGRYFAAVGISGALVRRF